MMRSWTSHRPDTGLGRFLSWAAQTPDNSCIRYFGTTLTWAEVDEISSRLAAAWASNGLQPESRVAIYTQNIPQYVLAMLAAWKCGSCIVPLNPMYKPGEITKILLDSRASILVAQADLVSQEATAAISALPSPPQVITTHAGTYATTWPDELPLPESGDVPDELLVLAEQPTSGWSMHIPRPDDLSALTYTSGTTGPPKGAMNTQGSLAAATSMYEEVMHLDASDSVICMAPLFHVSGLVGHMGIAFTVGMPMVLAYRFEPSLIARTIQEEATTYTIASITAFLALLGDDRAMEFDLSSLAKPYSGGAPVSPAVVDRYLQKTGQYIYNIYGLTEATGPVLAVPIGERAPVDPVSGALSAGKACPWTDVRIVDDQGEELPYGEIGELTCEGPQVVPGYWEKPEETLGAFPGGRLHTGDVAFRDSEGWFFIVDRIKDQINASGFKVWPREVEDAIMLHPDVHEVAVVGISDDYRGETVKAVVVPIPGSALTQADVVEFSRTHLAAFKVPRVVDIVDALPKTASGKVLRRELR